MLRPTLEASVILFVCLSLSCHSQGSGFRLQSLLSFPPPTDNSLASATLTAFEIVDDDQGGRIDLDQSQLQIRQQLLAEKHRRVDFIADYLALTLSSDAVFDSTGITIPEHWHDLGAGLRLHQEINGRLLSGFILAGSAADKPFHSDKELNLKATGVLRDPRGQHAAIIYLISLDTDRDYPILPGIAYEFSINQNNHMALGFPVLEYWGTLPQNTQVQLSFTPIKNVDLLIRHQLTARLRPYLSLKKHERYFNRAEREDSSDKVVFFDNRLSVGMSYQLTKQIDVDLAFGATHLFRRIGEGDGHTARKKNDVDMNNGRFIRLKLDFRY